LRLTRFGGASRRSGAPSNVGEAEENRNEKSLDGRGGDFASRSGVFFDGAGRAAGLLVATQKRRPVVKTWTAFSFSRGKRTAKLRRNFNGVR